MKAMRSSALVALVLLTALVVVVAPAFATPNITASSGTRAVSPFITPIGSTTSLSTARGTNLTIAVPALGSTVSCDQATVSGYVDTTHTQMKIISMSFGTGRAGSCTVRPAGTVDGNRFTCTATSANPGFFHAKTVNAAARSSSGSWNLTSSCSIFITILGRSYDITIDAQQSCSYMETFPPSSFVLSCRLVATITGALSASITIDFTLRITARPDTVADASMTVTAAS
jgi:hypothetical protein